MDKKIIYQSDGTAENNNNENSNSRTTVIYQTDNTAESINEENSSINDRRSNPTSYVDEYLYSDIGSELFDADVPSDTLSFYNLGIVHVDYVEMSREAKRITELSANASSQLGVLAGALSALASLVGYSIDLSGFDMDSLGLDPLSNVNSEYEYDYDGMSLFDSTASSYIMGLANNASYAAYIMNKQIQQYKELSGMTTDEIKELDALVNSILENTDLLYTNNEGEIIHTTYNSLINAYKAKEHQMYQIDNMNLYNADGSVNQDAIEKLNNLLNNEVENRSGKFMTIEEGNDLGYKQCTWWANARASQFLKENYPTLVGNGGDYYNVNLENKWFEYGDVPKPNSIVTYQFGEYGHVAYVEAVDYVDGKIYISDADSGKLFRGIEELDMDGKWLGYSPQGYIYLDSPITNTDTINEGK